MRGLRTSLRLAGIVLLAASGCAASQPVVLPSRPPLPDGWVRFASGGVQVAAPPEWGADIGGDPQSVMLSTFLPPGNQDGVGLIAIGPHGQNQPDRPFSDSSLADWLLQMITNKKPDFTSRSIVLLPAGRAVVVRATYSATTPDRTEVAAYAIPTGVGVVYLQVLIDSDLMDRYGEALDLIPRLLDLGSGSPPEPATP